tara:strand:+ start:488 stop:661 length:174 start_codon:yes stop_codon:yes gene_type:complete
MRHDEARGNSIAIEAAIIEADNRDDIEEDDGQPSEYDEWQDFMGGDEYYDHSENACW